MEDQRLKILKNMNEETVETISIDEVTLAYDSCNYGVEEIPHNTQLFTPKLYQALSSSRHADIYTIKPNNDVSILLSSVRQ